MTQPGNNRLALEWHLWRSAVVGLPANPVVQYFALAEQRRRQRQVNLRYRLTWIILVSLLVGLDGWIVYEAVGSYWSTRDLVSAIGGGLLGLISAVYALLLLNAIYTTVIDAFGVLGTSLEKRRARQLQLDDMVAVTQLNDHELAAGFLRIIAPRLWWLSLAGAVIIWLWWTLGITEFLYDIDPGRLIVLLLTAPLTIGGITFCGILGTVILLCWILVLGNACGSRYYGPVAAAMAGLGQAQHLLVAMAILVGLGLSGGMSSSNDIDYYMGGMIVATLVVVFFYRIFLEAANRRPGRYAWLVVLVPVLLPLTLATLAVMVNLYDFNTASFALLSLDMAWGSASVLNPLGVPSIICTGMAPELFDGNNNYGISGYTFTMELSYLIILAQQLAMTAIGLNALRRAIYLRRQSLA